MRAIILDDYPPFRKVLKMFLGLYETIQIVAEAGTAEEAVDVVERHSRDLIFADIMLPGMDGFEFSSIIKRRFPRTRLIFISLNDTPAYRKKARRLGVPYVSKDSLPENLFSILDNLGG